MNKTAKTFKIKIFTVRLGRGVDKVFAEFLTIWKKRLPTAKFLVIWPQNNKDCSKVCFLQTTRN